MNEIKKLTGALNPKLARKVARYLAENEFSYLQYQEHSDVFKAIHNALLVFLADDVTSDSVKIMLDILDIVIEQSLINVAVSSIKQIEEVEELILFFVQSYKEQRFGKQTLLLLKLLVNQWLFKNHYSLLVLRPSCTRQLKNMMDESGDLAVIRKLVVSFYQDDYARNTVVRVRTQQEMIAAIEDVKDVLMLQYGIIELSMFGSYANHTQNEFSDLDLLIAAKEELTAFEMSAINDYLSAMLELKVNVVVDFSFIHYEIVKVF